MNLQLNKVCGVFSIFFCAPTFLNQIKPCLVQKRLGPFLKNPIISGDPETPYYPKHGDQTMFGTKTFRACLAKRSTEETEFLGTQ